MPRTRTKIYERTIAKELHDAWLKLKRSGDGLEITEALKYSRPVIDRALLHGHVKMAGLADKITKFLMDRIERETAQASKLLAADKK